MNIQTWFNDRNLIVLNYQNKAITKANDSLKTNEITVLGACPSAGKTTMSINIIDTYLRNNPSHKVIVLTHGTTVLRTQFYESLVELNDLKTLSFTFNKVEKFKEFDINKQVNVCLPQTLNGKTLPKANLLVVDEAHHYYFAEMIQEIIKKSGIEKQLLLTGTPSSFIAKNIPIIPITLNTIHDEGMVADLSIDVAASNYNFDFVNDFNSDDELKTNVKFTQEDTNNSLNSLLNKTIDRLNQITGITYKEWLPALQRLQKTMIACNSIQQANQVENYFKKLGVICVKSTSDSDIDSSNINYFKNNNDCLVLIVVGRGILGFNYPKLANVVDMTASRNIDKIYQLLCRVTRVDRNNPEGKKLFFKIAPSNQMNYYLSLMQGVCGLFDEKWFTTYNGKNFNNFNVVVSKITQVRNSTHNKIQSNKKILQLNPIDLGGLDVFNFFETIKKSDDSIMNVYATASVNDIRAEFLKITPKGYWTLEKCQEDALLYSTNQQWRECGSGSYEAARDNNWIELCNKHMIEDIKSKGYWMIKENVLDTCRKSNNITEWMKKYPSAWKAAINNNWYDECSQIFKNNFNKPIKKKSIFDIFA